MSIHTIARKKPGLVIILGFLLLGLLGALLLSLPVSLQSGLHLAPQDALFTATSAVCVTGLIVVDAADTFTVFGRIVIAILIQIGGLGVASAGIAVILLMRRRVGFPQRTLMQEGLNLQSPRGAVRLLRAVLRITLCVEAIGAALCFPVFLQGRTVPQALGISVFHAIASFNNAGFDILGGMTNLIPYRANLWLNLVTGVMIFLGGIGYLVILDVLAHPRWRRLTLHSKMALSMSAALLVGGTLLLYWLEDIPLLGAAFTSVSTRTAGFTTYSLEGFTTAGRLIVILLMFTGASPGSTGGGIKTTTLLSIAIAVYAMAASRHPTAFRRTIPRDTLYRAFVVTTLSIGLCALVLLILTALEPHLTLDALLFETVSAFATVGLSTGITPALSTGSKLLLTLTMFIGRLGPLTVASLLTFRALPGAHYAQEPVPIG